MNYQYLLELDVGYHILHWQAAGSADVYYHKFADFAPINIFAAGTQLGERTSYAAVGATQSTWWADRGSFVYVHLPGNGTPGAATTVKIDSTWHFAREGVIIPKVIGTGGTVYPVFFDGRLETVPSVSYSANPDSAGGGIVPSVGNIVLRNADAYFDSIAPKVLWKNQAARLYIGTPGGTLPSGYTLRQQFNVDAPSLDRISLTIPTHAGLMRFYNPVNDGSTIAIISDGLSLSKPSPMVFGALRGVPAYFTGSSGTVGTYQLCSHPIGTVTSVFNSGGTSGTLLSSGSKFSAAPLADLGKDQCYVNGTGLTSGGAALFKAGEIMQYILASQARMAATSIATADFANIDTNRPVNVQGWFGRNETVADVMDALSQSAFANWSIGRNGQIAASLIQNTVGTAVAISDNDFENMAAFITNDPLENFSIVFPTALSSSKMLLYTNMLLKDSLSGTSFYSNGSFATTIVAGSPPQLRGKIKVNTPLTNENVKLYLYVNYTGTGSAAVLTSCFEASFGTGSPAMITLNKYINGTVSLLATAIASNSLSYGTDTSLSLYSLLVASGTYEVTADYGFNSMVTNIAPIAIGSGYIAGFSMASAGSLTNFGSSLVSKQYSGTALIIIQENYIGILDTLWIDVSGAAHKGTAIGGKAYSGTKAMHIQRGTNEIAHVNYGTGIYVVQGSSYALSLLAAKQEVTPGAGNISAFRLGFQDAAGSTHLSGSQWSLSTSAWSRTTHLFNPYQTGSGTIQIYPSYGGTLAGTCWVDFVEIYQIKPINTWQLSGFNVQIINPRNHQVSVKYVGTGTSTTLPAAIGAVGENAKDKYYTATAAGTNPALLFPGMERRVIPALCYNQGDATTVADAALAYYSKPRVRWEADYKDFRGAAINLWDVLYVQDGRFPGIPEEQRFLKVTQIEDSAPGGAPQTHIGGEFVFNAANDLLQLTWI